MKKMHRNKTYYQSKRARMDFGPEDRPKILAVRRFKCLHCKKPFYSSDYSARICSQDCRKIWRANSERDWEGIYGATGH